MSKIYHEKQSNLKCGLHALNNLMGRNMFSHTDLCIVARDMCREVGGQLEWFVDLDRGSYNVDVLRRCLMDRGYHCERELIGDSDVIGYLILLENRTGNHYITAKCVSEREILIIDSLCDTTMSKDRGSFTRWARTSGKTIWTIKDTNLNIIANNILSRSR